MLEFNATRFDETDDEGPLWGDNAPQTWPSTVILCVACVSLFLSIGVSVFSSNLVILLSYFKSVKWANRLAIAHTSITIGASIFLLVFWAISVGVFNVHSKSSTSDLWSWSCDKADDTEKYSINWGQYCLEQVTPFGHLI
jgi:hypothetical protein